MRRRRAGSQLWAFAYLVARRVLELLVLMVRSNASNEIELFVLLHEITAYRPNIRSES